MPVRSRFEPEFFTRAGFPEPPSLRSRLVDRQLPLCSYRMKRNVPTMWANASIRRNVTTGRSVLKNHRFIFLSTTRVRQTAAVALPDTKMPKKSGRSTLILPETAIPALSRTPHNIPEPRILLRPAIDRWQLDSRTVNAIPFTLSSDCWRTSIRKKLLFANSHATHLWVTIDTGPIWESLTFWVIRKFQLRQNWFLISDSTPP